MADIFICYRRDDSAGHAGWLHERLNQHFGSRRVFFDIDSIAPGENFVEKINRVVQKATVTLVVIGRSWLLRDASGRLRLSDKRDYVRLEVAAALNREGMRVIPVLVHGATMPSKRQLPTELAMLALRNYVVLHDGSWQRDVNRLIRSLERTVGKPNAGGVAGGRTRKKGPEPAATAKSETDGRRRRTSGAGDSIRAKHGAAGESAKPPGREPAKQSRGAAAKRAADSIASKERGGSDAGTGKFRKRGRKMNRSEFVDTVAERAELTRPAAQRVVEAIFDTSSGDISEAVHAAGALSIPGFGKFTKRTRAARKQPAKHRPSSSDRSAPPEKPAPEGLRKSPARRRNTDESGRKPTR